MMVIVIAVVWLLLGAAMGVFRARHGYWRHAWLVFALLGPFSVPFVLRPRRIPPSDAVVLARGRARRGRVDILVGLDGSRESVAAATVAVRLFGPRIGRVTLAMVLDFDTAAPHADSLLYPEPWPEERVAREQLEAGRAALRSTSGHEAGTVVLTGEPADALEAYALAEGYEVVVVGCRGKGLSKRLLGSCASELASRTAVPVLLVPHDPAHHEQEAATETTAEPVLQ
jgi:nucleotide-binding universal stress UspA family protein